MQVKPMQWKKYPEGQQVSSPLWNVQIWLLQYPANGDDLLGRAGRCYYTGIGPHAQMRTFATMTEAKAAAQAEYEAAILALLEDA